MPQMILSSGASSVDLSNKLTDWKPEIEPSYSFLDLSNGAITTKEDLGSSSDRFYCSLDLCLPTSEYLQLMSFYAQTKGKSLLLQTDLDLFIPSIIPNGNQVLVTEIKPQGYLSEDIMSDYRLVSLRLLLLDPMSFGDVSTATSRALDLMYSLSIWTNETILSDKVQTKSIGQGYSFQGSNNGSSSWVVEFNLLTKVQAYYLTAWLLSVRSSVVDIPLCARNANKITDSTLKVNLRDFQLGRVGNYYTLHIDAVER